MKIIFLPFLLAVFLTATPAFASTIKLNEFYSAGSTSAEAGPDWVEIYNEGNDISLYQLLDSDNHAKNLSSANCNGNFCTIDWSNLLNNSGDTIKLVLISAPESIIDQVTYGNSGNISVPETGQSGGKSPDESGSWMILSIPSKGSTNNSSPTPTPSPTSTPTETPTPTSSPTSTQTPTPTKTPTSTKAPTSTSVPAKKPTSISKPSPTSSEKSSVNLPASILGTNSAIISPDISPPTQENNQTKESLLKKISTIGGILILFLSVALIATFIVRNRSLKV